MLYKLTTFLRLISCQSDNFAMIKTELQQQKKINYLQLWQIL